MAGTAKLAWRNLGRNRRRTVITAVALAVGMSLCVASYGWMDGINADILHALTRFDLGHVQVHNPEYPREHKLKETINDPGRVEARAKAIEGVVGVSARVYGFALASHRTKSAGVQLVGVDPATEPTVTELDRHIAEGRYLERQPTPWPKGRELTEEERAEDRRLTERAEADVLAEIDALSSERPAPEGERPDGTRGASDQTSEISRQLAAKVDPPPARPPGVILGADLARILKLKAGQTLFLISQTVDGLSAEARFRVIGIYRTGTSQYDRSRVYLNIADLQRFLRLGNRVHEITVLTRSAERSASVATRLASRVNGSGDRGVPPAHPTVLVRTWDQIRPDIKSMIQLNQASMVLMVAIIFLVAALGVVNTMLMAVFERTRELGMLKALGMSGWRILWLVVVETTLLVLVGSLFGVALGVGLDLYMMIWGINLGAMTEGISMGGMGLAPTIHAVITLEGVLAPVVVLALMCFLGALYPGIRAARMRPAQGMREV
jgi:ABC-type lipoprotein release transport system permease subunit